MERINADEHKRIILEFLKASFPYKNPVLQEARKKHVYRCYNKDGSIGKLLALASECERVIGLKSSDPLFIEVSRKIEEASPIIFIGRNYITVDKDWQRAVNRLKAVNPNRDWNMFEIEEFQGYSIVWD